MSLDSDWLFGFQVVLGGGQDASAVTTTDHRAGKFEAKFYDKVQPSAIYLITLELQSWFGWLIFPFPLIDPSRRDWRCERAFWTHQRSGFQPRWKEVWCIALLLVCVKQTKSLHWLDG